MSECNDGMVQGSILILGTEIRRLLCGLSLEKDTRTLQSEGRLVGAILNFGSELKRN